MQVRNLATAGYCMATERILNAMRDLQENLQRTDLLNRWTCRPLAIMMILPCNCLKVMGYSLFISLKLHEYHGCAWTNHDIQGDHDFGDMRRLCLFQRPSPFTPLYAVFLRWQLTKGCIYTQMKYAVHDGRRNCRVMQGELKDLCTPLHRLAVLAPNCLGLIEFIGML